MIPLEEGNEGHATVSVTFCRVRITTWRQKRSLESVPAALINIPLEYFEKTIGWLQERIDVDGEKLAVIGHSRGGELALLLGATFPAIKTVVAGSPSGFVHGGIKYAPTSLPSWTYHGEALPYIPYKSTFKESMGFFKNFITRTPMTMRESFLKRMPDEGVAEKVSIPVEKTQGPILLIAGKDDQLWPSDIYCEQVMERLSAHKFGYAYEHLSYEWAGHFLCFPYGIPSLPPMTRLSPGGGVTIDFGGSARANAGQPLIRGGKYGGFWRRACIRAQLIAPDTLLFATDHRVIVNGTCLPRYIPNFFAEAGP